MVLLVCGHLVTLFGMASGEHEPTRFQKVTEKGIYYTVSSIMLYKKELNELLASLEDHSSIIEKGEVRVRVNHKYPLSQVVQTHSYLES